MNTLVYIRSSTATVAKVTHRVIVKATKMLRLGGLWKSGSIPGGGLMAGPSSSMRSAAWACAGVVELAILNGCEVRCLNKFCLKQEFVVYKLGNAGFWPPTLLNYEMKHISNWPLDNSAGIVILSTPLALPQVCGMSCLGSTPSHSRHDSYSLGAAQ